MNFPKLEKSLKVKIVTTLIDFDIPMLRIDVSKPENVRWMLRNMHVRNFTNPNFNLVMVLLTILSEGYKE
jgi:hypothetical protein